MVNCYPNELFFCMSNIIKIFTLILAVIVLQSCKKDDGDKGKSPSIETLSISSTTHSFVRSGGLITSKGEGRVFRKGLCWSLSPSPNIESDSILLDNSSELEFELAVYNLTPNTTYYLRAFATNINGVSYGEELSFTTKQLTEYSVGDIGPAGGYVFYDKGEYSDHWQYLESAPQGWFGTDEDPTFHWGCFRTFLRADNTKIGSGKNNTNTIFTECGDLSYAAKACLEFSNVNNDIHFSDWFLPSKDELDVMYQALKLNEIGGFQDSYYWSSSEMTALIAWLQGYDNGLQYKNLFRINEVKVRPVRAF